MAAITTCWAFVRTPARPLRLTCSIAQQRLLSWDALQTSHLEAAELQQACPEFCLVANDISHTLSSPTAPIALLSSKMGAHSTVEGSNPLSLLEKQAKRAIFARLDDGSIWDLQQPLTHSCRFEVITSSNWESVKTVSQSELISDHTLICCTLAALLAFGCTCAWRCFERAF
jgi:hypothetical protein